MRRIVTGEGPDGRSMSVSEGPPPRSVALRRRGDMTIEVLWEVAMPPQSPAAGATLTSTSRSSRRPAWPGSGC